jgi:hypothetical protein
MKAAHLLLLVSGALACNDGQRSHDKNTVHLPRGPEAAEAAFWWLASSDDTVWYREVGGDTVWRAAAKGVEPSPAVGPSHASAIACDPRAATCQHLETAARFTGVPWRDGDSYYDVGGGAMAVVARRGDGAFELLVWPRPGGQFWRQQLAPEVGLVHSPSIAADRAGEVLVATFATLQPGQPGRDLKVLRLRLADGAVLWQRDLKQEDSATYVARAFVSSDRQRVIVVGTRGLAGDDRHDVEVLNASDGTTTQTLAVQALPPARGTFETADVIAGHLWTYWIELRPGRTDRNHLGAPGHPSTWVCEEQLVRVTGAPGQSAAPTRIENCRTRAVRSDPDGTITSVDLEPKARLDVKRRSILRHGR